MNIGLFFKFLISDKLNKPVKLKNQKLVRYAIEMNYIQYIVEGYDDDLNPICKENSYSLEFEGRNSIHYMANFNFCFNYQRFSLLKKIIYIKQ